MTGHLNVHIHVHKTCMHTVMTCTCSGFKCRNLIIAPKVGADFACIHVRMRTHAWSVNVFAHGHGHDHSHDHDDSHSYSHGHGDGHGHGHGVFISAASTHIQTEYNACMCCKHMFECRLVHMWLCMHISRCNMHVWLARVEALQINFNIRKLGSCTKACTHEAVCIWVASKIASPWLSAFAAVCITKFVSKTPYSNGKILRNWCFPAT